MKLGPILIGLLAVQVFCAGFFLWDILSSLLGLQPISWRAHELMEIGAAFGLILGAIMGGLVVRRAVRRTARVEDQLRAASGAFMDVLDEKFVDWNLTPAEQDVALFSIKGLSTAEIAVLRDTSEGTVKAQTNAIYRKAGVTGRPQLLSLFIEDLMDGPLPAASDADAPPPVRVAVETAR